MKVNDKKKPVSTPIRNNDREICFILGICIKDNQNCIFYFHFHLSDFKLHLRVTMRIRIN